MAVRRSDPMRMVTWFVVLERSQQDKVRELTISAIKDDLYSAYEDRGPSQAVCGMIMRVPED